MWRDTRAQSVGIAQFFLSLVVALIVAWIVKRIATPILDGASANTQTGAQATAWITTGIDSLFLAFLVIAVFGVVALAVFQREVLS